MKKCILSIIGICFLLLSCQNETVTEDTTLIEDELLMEDEILASDGEEDLEFILNEESEKPITTSSLFRGSSNDCTPDIEGLESNLPGTVDFLVQGQPGTLDSDFYFLVDVFDPNEDDTSGFLTGTYGAFCVDRRQSIDDILNSTAGVVSSREVIGGDNLDDRITSPENMDKVNWVLNQEDIFENYTYGQVQYAIWTLLGEEDDCEGNCNDTFLTFPTNKWNNTDVLQANAIVERAIIDGAGFSPGCGELLGIVLVPSNKQAVIIPVPVPEAECSDCEGKVTQLELEWDWHRSKKVKMYQRIENTCYGTKIFDQRLYPGDTFTINGTNHDGTFGKYVYIYIKNRYGYYCYYTKIKTNCYINIGPGYTKGVFNVISGMSSEGGELCEYEAPDNHCYRHWSCSGYNSCRYN